MLKTNLARRIFAALWFAAAASFPVGLFLRFWGMPGNKPMIVLIIGVPILAAGTGGAIFGAGILNAEKVKSVLGAFVRGLAIAMLSYLILFVSLFARFSWISGDLPKEFDLVSTVFLYSLFTIGWLIAALGAAAGGLLYLFQARVPLIEPKGF